jgi:hypothetical protein
MATHDLVAQLKDKGRLEGRLLGRLEGRRAGLLRIYRARFGAVSSKVRAAVERNGDIASIEKWVAMFAIRSAAQIAAAVAAKKAKPRLSARRAS